MNRGVLIDLGRRIFFKNFYLKFIAAILALALYIWVSEDRETVVAGYARVQTVVPDEMVLVSDPIDRVKVTVRGRWTDIDRFDPGDLDPIRLDLSPTDSGSLVSITPDMIGIPPNLRVTDIDPDSMYVELEPEIYETLPVEPRITGSPRSPYTIEETRITPETIPVSGPQSRLAELDAVSTEPVDVTDRTESFEQQVQPRIDDGLLAPEHDQPLLLEVDIETEEITTTIDDLPVDAVNTSYETSVEPSVGELTITGPEPVVSELDTEPIRLEIDLSDEDDRPPGTFSRSAEAVNLRPELEVEHIHPERFRVVTRAPEGDIDDEETTDVDDADDSL